MEIQSLSVVVPNEQCINHCASCPSRMHDNNYPILLNERKADFGLYLDDYIKRLEFARDNGCNTLMLTGTSEPQQNRTFLTWFGMMMKMMKSPFRNIEMQCTGVLLDASYIEFLRRHVGVTLIALSIFSLSKDANMNIIRPPVKTKIDPVYLAEQIKLSGLSLRVCLNLTNDFDQYSYRPDKLFDILEEVYHADQVTLRVLYAGEDDCPENEWVRQNAAREETVKNFKKYIKMNGMLLGKLPYGACKYGYRGMSVVIDDDSMGKETNSKDSYKYLILRPDCKLYSAWDNKGSLIF